MEKFVKTDDENIHSEIVAYTSDNNGLMLEQYRKRVTNGIEQCMKGECISLEELSKELERYDFRG
jgi:hypothetical protein